MRLRRLGPSRCFPNYVRRSKLDTGQFAVYGRFHVVTGKIRTYDTQVTDRPWRYARKA